MAGLGGSGRYSFETSGKKELMCGTVKDIKASPEGGKKRLIVKEKGASNKSFAVDIDMMDAKNLKRKETYAFQVEEKSDDRYGSQGRKKESGFRTYYCDTTPEKYGGAGSRSQFADFSGGNRW